MEKPSPKPQSASRLSLLALLALTTLGACAHRSGSGRSETPCDGVDSTICDEQRKKGKSSFLELEMRERERSVEALQNQVNELRGKILASEQRVQALSSSTLPQNAHCSK